MVVRVWFLNTISEYFDLQGDIPTGIDPMREAAQLQFLKSPSQKQGHKQDPSST